jgi:hypothetical protein
MEIQQLPDDLIKNIESFMNKKEYTEDYILDQYEKRIDLLKEARKKLKDKNSLNELYEVIKKRRTMRINLLIKYQEEDDKLI